MVVKKVKYIGETSPVTLIKGKVYEVAHNDPKHGWYGIVDESEEEYAYPPELFEIVEKDEKKEG